MKKIATILFLLIYFLINSPSFCQDDFFTKDNYKEAISIDKKPKKIKQPKDKFKFFKNFKKKKKNKDEVDIEQKGYYGTIPDLEQAFKYKQQEAMSAKEKNTKTFEDEDEADFQEAPFDDPLFLDKVIKKEKTSNYINDLQRLRFAINSLKECIEKKEDIRRFNGCVNSIDLYTKALQTKYQNTSDSFRESYINIINLNYKAKVLGNLIYEANYYAQYTSINDSKYSKNNIDLQKDRLLRDINRTLFAIIKEE